MSTIPHSSQRILLFAFTLSLLAPSAALASTAPADAAGGWNTQSYIILVLALGLAASLAVHLRSWRARRAPMEVLHIQSDPQTVFTGSTVPGKVNARKPAAIVPHPRHPEWELADNVFKTLANCQWIAEDAALTHEEALHGGVYSFEREFEVPKAASEVVSAELLALVDNWCSPSVNGQRLNRQGGKFELFRWDLKDVLHTGSNLVSFDVENSPGGSYLSDDPNWRERNPYGLKYLIRVHYKA